MSKPFPDLSALKLACETWGRAAVCERAGIHQSTLCRALAGDKLEAGSLIGLGRVIGLSADEAIRSMKVIKTWDVTGEALLSKIDGICRNDPSLTPESAASLMRLFRVAYKEITSIT